MQLTEGQEVETYYGILEKQMVHYCRVAEKFKGETGDALLQKLECRLDNMVYRIGFVNSTHLIHQQVTHGHIPADGKKLSIPPYAIQPGDITMLREKSRSNELFCINFLDGGGFAVPYLERDFNALGGTLTRSPNHEEIPVEVNDQLVVEYYSK